MYLISKNSVTVVIVNWNSNQLLQKCLHALNQQTYQIDKILVIDNASIDSPELILANFANTQLIVSNTNLGFAGGNNLALENTNTAFIALLNPDAYPEPSWIKNLILSASLHKECAAFGSKQLSLYNNELLDGTGDDYHLSGRVWRKGYNCPFTTTAQAPQEIFSPCAAAALYRRSALEEIGFFDEDYFCYVEDVDLGFRLRLAGYKALYVPDAIVHHVGSATTGGQQSDFSVYHGHRNLVWTYIKNMPPLLFWTCLPLHLALNLFTIVWFSLKGQRKIILKAKWDALKGIPKMWKKRQQIQKNRKATTLDIWRALNKNPIPRRPNCN